jgi:hypothetical protein
MNSETTLVLDRPAATAWLADHSPRGNAVVAGAVLCEWLLGPGDATLRDLRFRRPLRVPQEGARVRRMARRLDGREVVSLLAPRVGRDGRLGGEVDTAGAVRAPSHPWSPVPAGLSGPDVRETSIDPTFHGPTFRVLDEPIRCGREGLDAGIRISGDPPDVAPWRSGRDVRLLDGLFQAAGLCRTRSGLVRGAPCGAQRLTWAATAGGTGRFEVRVRWTDPDDPVRMGIWCLDPAGSVAVELSGYHAAPAGFMSGGNRD